MGVRSEAQGNWADFSGSNVSIFIPRWTNNSKIEAFGLFTGQVGYAWNNVLWYVKGGAAVTDDKYRGTVTTAPFQGDVFDSASETRWGGVIGTGLEFGFAPNWSVAIEYDHLFMGNRDITLVSRGVLGGSRLAATSAPTRSVRTSTSLRRVSTTTSAARSSRGTDRVPSPVNFEAPATSGAFFGTPRVRGTVPSQGRCEGAVMRPASATAPAPRAGIQSAGQREGGRYQ